MAAEVRELLWLNRWSPATLAAPIGRYSHLAVVPPGHALVFVSGQVGNDSSGTLVSDEAEGQTRQAFANIAAVLEELRATPDAIVKLVTFVAGERHLPGFYSARDETFDAWFPQGDVPAHSLAVVAALADPALTVEIEAVVALSAP